MPSKSKWDFNPGCNYLSKFVLVYEPLASKSHEQIVGYNLLEIWLDNDLDSPVMDHANPIPFNSFWVCIENGLDKITGSINDDIRTNNISNLRALDTESKFRPKSWYYSEIPQNSFSIGRILGYVRGMKLGRGSAVVNNGYLFS